MYIWVFHVAFPSSDISNLVFGFLLYFSRNKTEGIRVEREGGARKKKRRGTDRFTYKFERVAKTNHVIKKISC